MGASADVNKLEADIGIFGGSGFYKFFSECEEHAVETPYGAPSDRVFIGTLHGKRIAFLPRHGLHHSIPPHKINYRANLWAMKSLGVKRIISPCAAGSLQKNVAPGHFVICDQFVDRTSGRADTFYDGPISTHVSSAEPYCPEMRKAAIEACRGAGIVVHEHGTVVVVQGPRFSSKAESRWFGAQGWEVINMTQYPEVHLAKELEMCVVNVSLITDYDSGLHGNVEPVSHSEVVKVFSQNLLVLQKMLSHLIQALPAERAGCNCATALEHARIL